MYKIYNSNRAYGVRGRELQQLVILEHDEMHARNSVASRLCILPSTVYTRWRCTLLSYTTITATKTALERARLRPRPRSSNALLPGHTAGNYCNRLETCLTQDHELQTTFILENCFRECCFLSTHPSLSSFHNYSFNQHYNYQ